MPQEGSQYLTDLYRRYLPAIYRRAHSLLGDEQEARDVVHETFLGYMQAHKTLRPGASAFTILYQIATYKAVDGLRRRSRWSGTLKNLSIDETEAGDGTESGGGGQGYEGGGDGGVQRIDAARDLALLTDGERPEVKTAALLYFVEGYTTEEVGQMLDLSRKTVGKMLAQFAERAKRRSAHWESSEAPS